LVAGETSRNRASASVRRKTAIRTTKADRLEIAGSRQSLRRFGEREALHGWVVCADGLVREAAGGAIYGQPTPGNHRSSRLRVY
jgi:hypothetical protein